MPHARGCGAWPRRPASCAAPSTPCVPSPSAPAATSPPPCSRAPAAGHRGARSPL